MDEAERRRSYAAANEFQIRHRDFSFNVPVPTDADFIIDRMRRKSRFYESDLLDYLSLSVKGDGVVVDCGANIGNHTLFFAGVMGRRVLAIEPIKRNRAILERLIAANQIESQVQIVPAAVGDRNGEVLMASPRAENPGMFRITEDAAIGELVSLTTVDDIVADLTEPVALMKFDLEGFEEPALRGAMKTITRCRPLVVAELSNRDEFQSFFGHLQGLGYEATNVFCATPTVVFEHTGASGAVAEGVLEKLGSHASKQARRERTAR